VELSLAVEVAPAVVVQLPVQEGQHLGIYHGPHHHLLVDVHLEAVGLNDLDHGIFLWLFQSLLPTSENNTFMCWLTTLNLF
jgi:hypothetical protein